MKHGGSRVGLDGGGEVSQSGFKVAVRERLLSLASLLGSLLDVLVAGLLVRVAHRKLDDVLRLDDSLVVNFGVWNLLDFWRFWSLWLFFSFWLFGLGLFSLCLWSLRFWWKSGSEPEKLKK